MQTRVIALTFRTHDAKSSLAAAVDFRSPSGRFRRAMARGASYFLHFRLEKC
jgi:hypothetical protein